jgi:hypothetical protein
VAYWPLIQPGARKPLPAQRAVVQRGRRPSRQRGGQDQNGLLPLLNATGSAKRLVCKQPKSEHSKANKGPSIGVTRFRVHFGAVGRSTLG